MSLPKAAAPGYPAGRHEPRLRVGFEARATAEVITTWVFNIHTDIKCQEKPALVAAGNPATDSEQPREIAFSRPRLLAGWTGMGFTSGN